MYRRLIATFGNSDHGRLGHGLDCGGQLFPTVVQSLQDLNIKQVACGGAHTVVLADDGSVHTFGDNSCGQLGHSEELQMTVSPQQVPVPEAIAAISAGETHTACISESGAVWTWGSNGDGQLGIGPNIKSRIVMPRRIASLAGERVVQVVTGAQHSMALTGNGDVLSWGNGCYGALGLGQGRTGVEFEPMLVRALQGARVCHLAAGYHHSGAVDGMGFVHCWGYNRFWQLGLGHETNIHTPIQVPKLSRVKQLALGMSHSMALTLDGRLAVWGTDEGGCLGLGFRWPVHPCKVPQLVLHAPAFSQIASGWKHSGGVTNDGRLYMWGWGGSPGGSELMLSGKEVGAGQLGLGDDRDMYEIVGVFRLSLGDGRYLDSRQQLGLRFLKLSLGRNHSAALVYANAASP